MKLNVVLASVLIAFASAPSSYAAALGPVATAAPRLQKRVFPTGSAAVASFLSTIQPGELSTYFSWAAHGNAGFISHAQSFTSANAAQYSSYLSAKGIDASEASAILGGIQTESTEGNTATSAAASGSSSSSSTGPIAGTTTLADGDVVVAITLTDANGSAVTVSTTNSAGQLQAASTTVSTVSSLATATNTTSSSGSSASSTATSTSTGGSSSSSASASTTSGSSSSQTDGAIHSLSLPFGSILATIFASLFAACFVL